MENRKDRYYYGHKKQWNAAFNTHQRLAWYNSHFEERRMMTKVEDSLDIFLGDLEQGSPSSQAEEIRAFCRPSKPVSNAEATQETQRAWLDDREAATGYTRKYKDRLTASQLHTFLRQPRLGSSHLPDVDRRLIYIADLDPEYVLALTETVPHCEVDMLRDAVWQHLAHQTALRVGIRPTGFPLWNLEFHLPYLALVKQVDPARLHSDLDADIKKGVNRKWTDLSFLRIQKPSDELGDVCGLHEAHISLVLCGADNFRYTGYLFVDRCSLGDSGNGTEYRDYDLNDDDDNDDDNEEGDTVFDPFFSNAGGDYIAADRPVWDPREYFLLIMCSRMHMVEKSWTYIVRTIEVRVRNKEQTHGNTLTRTGGARHDLAEAVRWVSEAIYVLEQLRTLLSTTIEAWNDFDTSGGDIDYFSDLPSAWLHIERIRKTFRELRKLHAKLDEMRRICKTLSKSLALFMNLESNRLNLDSNRMNADSYELNWRTTELNHKTNVVALDTHKISRLAFSINQMLIPIGIAVVLLGSEHNTFRLRRDPMTFIFCVFGLFLFGRLFALISHIASRSEWFRTTVIQLGFGSVVLKGDTVDHMQEKVRLDHRSAGWMA